MTGPASVSLDCADGELAVSWTAAEGAVRYKWQVLVKSSDGSKSKIKDSGRTKKLFANAGDGDPGTVYLAKVKALSKSKRNSVWAKTAPNAVCGEATASEDTANIVEEPAQVAEDTADAAEDTADIVEEPDDAVEDTADIVEEPDDAVEDTADIVEDDPAELVEPAEGSNEGGSGDEASLLTRLSNAQDGAQQAGVAPSAPQVKSVSCNRLSGEVQVGWELNPYAHTYLYKLFDSADSTNPVEVSTSWGNANRTFQGVNGKVYRAEVYALGTAEYDDGTTVEVASQPSTAVAAAACRHEEPRTAPDAPTTVELLCGSQVSGRWTPAPDDDASGYWVTIEYYDPSRQQIEVPVPGQENTYRYEYRWGAWKPAGISVGSNAVKYSRAYVWNGSNALPDDLRPHSTTRTKYRVAVYAVNEIGNSPTVTSQAAVCLRW